MFKTIYLIVIAIITASAAVVSCLGNKKKTLKWYLRIRRKKIVVEERKHFAGVVGVIVVDNFEIYS